MEIRKKAQFFFRIRLFQCPLSKGLPGILIELKAGKDCTEKQLKQLSETALRQINENKYDIDLKAAGIDHIYKYGVAFCGKNVEIAVEL